MILRTLLAVAIGLSVFACSSPEAPPAASTPVPAANPPATGSAAGTPAAPGRPIDGYPEASSVNAELGGAIADVARDLERMAAGRADARADLVDDLLGLADNEALRADIDALSQQLAATLPKATTVNALTPRLAELLFVAVRPLPMSDARLGELAADVQKALARHGVTEESARSIATLIGTVSRAARRAA